MNETFFYNQQFLPAHTPCLTADDRGLTLGDGVFETILSYDYKMPFFEQHWLRLTTSLALLAIKLPDKYNKNYVIGIINKLLEKNNVKTTTWHGIKIIVTRGAGPRSLEPKADYAYESNVLISCFAVAKPQLHTRSLRVDFTNKVNQHSILPTIKSLNYLDKIIAKQLAITSHCDDALLVNIDSNICEATTSNIFFILDSNEIITPKVSDGVLPGITRGFILSRLKELNYKVFETSVNTNDVIQKKLSITAAFVTNAIIGPQIVNRIDKLELVLDEHPIIELLYSEFLKRFDYLPVRGRYNANF